MSFTLPPINKNANFLPSIQKKGTNASESRNESSLAEVVRRTQMKKSLDDKLVPNKNKFLVDFKQKESDELKRLKELEEERIRENEKKARKIEAERARRKEISEEKKKNEYNIDQLKDRKKMKERRQEMLEQAQEVERKIAEVKIKKKMKEMRIKAEKEAAKMNEKNEKMRLREEEFLRARRFSKELADRQVLITNRIENGKDFNYNDLNPYKFTARSSYF